MENKNVKSGSGAVKLVNRSARLVALAAAAYFFFGPEGKKHRDDAKSWAVKMKVDVLKRIKAARDISEPAYRKIIDFVAAKHEKGRMAAPKEIKALAQDLKKHWQKISKSAPAAKRKAAKKAGKAIKKLAPGKKRGAPLKKSR